MSKIIHVLGIESSCDDTGVAILRDDRRILANCIDSQLKRHLNHGGIIPMVAKEYHLDSIDRVAQQAFRESRLNSAANDIDAVAVATRPGLDHSLQVGMSYAKQLAKKYSKPLIPIHHMQAHALMPLFEHRTIKYPFLALLLSGGHCLISICKRYNDFDLLGSSLDDAPGDLLDKAARRYRLRNLGPPFDELSGGAAIELLSKRSGADRFRYFNSEDSIPMLKRAGCNMSFSGYRGIVDACAPQIDELWKRGDREALLNELANFCGSIQRAILIQLAKKLQRALAYYRLRWRHQNEQFFASSPSDDNSATDASGFGVRSFQDSDRLDVVISGGVAANEYLVEGLREFCRQEMDDEAYKVYATSKSLCSDNGLMIAWNGLLRYQDFLRSPNCFNDRKSLDDGVIVDSEDQLEAIRARPVCPIGADISQHVDMATFKMPRFVDPELKLQQVRPANSSNSRHD